MISIVVSTYNREQYIVECLNSVAHQKGSKDNWELIIVNNNSSDKTGDLILAFLDVYKEKINVSYYIESSQGLSYARNRGIKESRGSFLVFIDDDAFLAQNYIFELLKNLQKYDVLEGLAFGGRIYPYLESPLPNWMSPYLMPLMSVLDWGEEVKEFVKKTYPIGANMGFSKSLISKVGNFNTSLGRVGKNTMGGEEKDFFLRIKKEKIKIYYFPMVKVNHVVPDTRLTKEFIKKLAIGIGRSERIRSKTISEREYIKSLFLEFVKWGGSILLSVRYLITFSLPKSKMLLKFRWWVSKGLLLKRGS